TLNWQLYSYDLDTHATFHAVRKACEPTHIQYDHPPATITVINTTLNPLKSLKATATVHALDGKPLASTTTNLDISANCAITLGKAPTPPSTNTTVWLLRLELRADTLLSRNDYWLATRPELLQSLDTLPRVSLKGQTETRGKWITVKLQNPSLTPAIMIRLTLRDPKTGTRILPAYYSDNYFNLLPGEPRIITIEAPKPSPDPPQVTAHGWNITPTTIR
ncbi:MAG: glycoside hydrolase family 2, partial [Verrucomicrobiae bacterium]|nr:glycoside hydrolase family 2 [Verrucomicrobiae bacterium]